MFEQKSIIECERELKTNIISGLSEEEAKKRLHQNGKNILEEHKSKSVISLFFSQLNDPMIYILFAAILISVVLKEISDAIIVSVVIFVNAIVSTIQESKAEKAMEALKKMSSPTCIVRRNEKVKEINAENLVVGDIVELEAGRRVPADVRFVETNSLKVEEASLTGESTSVSKDAKIVLKHKVSLGDQVNMGFMSTNVVNGRGVGVVIATGMSTQVGKIADMLKNEKNEMTPLQKKLADLGKLLGVLTVALCVGLFFVAVIQKRNVYEMLLNSISLAVAAIPEGLPAVVTIVLALGVQRMAKVNTIIRKLPSVETLGAVSVVCSDKTGTLTQNKMTVKNLYCSRKKYFVDDAEGCSLLIEGMVLCNDVICEGEELVGDPTEIALVTMGNEKGIKKELLLKKYPRINEIPFDSERKMMSTSHYYGGKKRTYTKGALDKILNRCTKIYENGEIRKINQDDVDYIFRVSREISEKALRVLALAYKEDGVLDEKNLIFVGMVGMIDPPRPEVKNAVNVLRKAGITTVMITGDHKDTAFAIASELGIAGNQNECVSGDEIEKMSKEEFFKKIKQFKVFARVTPAHKVQIVKALKNKGDVVSMTGDGVNDAPSLKAADIGIAMGKGGTDVAKETADMILSDDNFATIEEAVEEGRTVYANIKKSVLFLLSSNFAEVIVMFVAIMLNFPVPLIAVHILWVNLLTDSVPALALGSDPKEDDVMSNPPRNPNDSLFSNGGIKCTVVYGVLIGFLTLFAFVSVPIAEIFNFGLGLSFETMLEVLMDGEILKKAQTFAFATLAVSELFHAVGMLNVRKTVIRKEIFNNKLMIFAVIIGIMLQVLVTEVPFLNVFFKTSNLSFAEWCYIIGLGLLTLVIHELMVIVNKTKK